MKRIAILVSFGAAAWACEWAHVPGTPSLDPGIAASDPGSYDDAAAQDPLPADPLPDPAPDPWTPPDVAKDPIATDPPHEVTPPQCGPCTATSCPAGLTCSAVGSGKFCLKDCTSSAECPGGYVCYPISTAGKQCLPMSYNCVECAWEGCPEGKSCDLVSGQCVDTVKTCGKCTYDFQCGDGARCFKKAQATTGVCVPECPAGACADPLFKCAQNADGIAICAPLKDEYCQPCPPGQFLLGDGKTCVECLNDTHCIAKDPAKPTCDPDKHTCGEFACKPPTKKCADGKCHACCIDADCPSDGCGGCVNFACAGCLSECEKAGIDCSTNPYYSACCVIDGYPTCCGCNDVADCVKQFPEHDCECQNNTCIDSATSEACGGTISECPATCLSDADCPPPMSGTGTLACKLTQGYCYDPTGSCDNVVACCAPGRSCYALATYLSMIPPPRGGYPAMCTCGSDADCWTGGPCFDMNALCTHPLYGSMLCPGGKLPDGVPKGLCGNPLAVPPGI
jgi:hypothetical protein